jgi:hypothetical protein
MLGTDETNTYNAKKNKVGNPTAEKAVQSKKSRKSFRDSSGVVKQDSEKHGIKDKFSWMSPTRKQIPMTVG